MQAIILYVKPYVRKFLIKNYGKEPVYVRADSDLGKIVRLALSNEIVISTETPDDVASSPRVDGAVKLKLALSFRVGRGKITEENLEKTTIAIENEFNKAMFHFVKGIRSLRISESRAVKMFLDDYGIDEDEDIKLDTAIKMAQRSRAEKDRDAAKKL